MEIKAQEASMQGSAKRIPAKEVPSMLKSQGGTLKAQIQVIRKGTGEVKNYTLIMGDKKPEDKAR